MEFEGFSPGSLAFFRDVAEHNSKAWFEANRGRYERDVLAPFRALVAGLGELMLDIDAGLEVRPAVNKTISRIHRDTRFSADKSPLRDHMWLVFKRPRGDWQDAPAFYFELSADGYRHGMGYYAPSPQTMAAFRSHIDADPDAFRALVGAIGRARRFRLAGEDYKRPPGRAHDRVVAPWYRKRSFYLVRERKPDRALFSSDLLEELSSGFHLLAPLYRLLLELRLER